jgi:hypothetical protein
MSFAALKRSSGNVEKLTKELEKLNTNQTNNSEDTRFWKVTTDKAGNGYAVIRFLAAPAVDGEDSLPWVRIFDHGFQGPGGWYIENSLTTLNQKDPVSEYNSVLWNSGVETNKEVARKQKRRLKYISNIMVIQDPSNPENDGKVFLYKYGKKIFNKITESMNPQFEDEKPVNPFDFWNGANFKLKVRNVEGYQNYDKSSFDAPTALFDGDDAKLESLWKKEYSLKEFLDAKNFKSYEDLKRRLDRVLGLDGSAPVSKSVESDNKSRLVQSKPQVPVTQAVDDDDDDLKYFKKLAEDE